MQKQHDGLFVIQGPGTSLLHYGFGQLGNEVTVTCPDCGGTSVISCRTEPDPQALTMEHAPDCKLLALIERAAS